MAISSSVRAVVILAGFVERVVEKKRKAENGGGVFAHEITLRQDNEARAKYTLFDRDNAPLPPSLGDFVAAECSIEESREYGATLAYERPAFDVLDQIQSKLSAA